MKILVALSGGIDSSVVACLLHAQGHELIGVRFSLWTDPLAPAMAQLLPSKCCNAQTAARTAAVVKKLNIPFHVVSLEDAFKREVVDPFLESYRIGETPNPCINCNKSLKFGELIRLADEWGCEKLATGHYARVVEEKLEDGSVRSLLLESPNTKKDQSYYLHGLSQEQLTRVLFPLGQMEKSEVFTLAREYGIPFDEQYQESQDICFFPENDSRPFLSRHISDAITPGSIVRKDGTVVGAHTGLPFYTIGQRRGLGIGGLSIPLEVISKNVDSNELIVDEQQSNLAKRVSVRDLHWISWAPEQTVHHVFDCRTRSLSPRHSGTFHYNKNEGVFVFDTPLPFQAPGQSLVLYKGEEIVGGGVISSSH